MKKCFLDTFQLRITFFLSAAVFFVGVSSQFLGAWLSAWVSVDFEATKACREVFSSHLLARLGSWPRDSLGPGSFRFLLAWRPMDFGIPEWFDKLNGKEETLEAMIQKSWSWSWFLNSVTKIVLRRCVFSFRRNGNSAHLNQEINFYALWSLSLSLPEGGERKCSQSSRGTNS